MANEGAAISSIIVTALIAVVWYWRDCMQKVPLDEVGTGSDVDRVLKWESDGLRQEILARGWVTRYQWRSMHEKMLKRIDDELKRRADSSQ